MKKQTFPEKAGQKSCLPRKFFKMYLKGEKYEKQNQ